MSLILDVNLGFKLRKTDVSIEKLVISHIRNLLGVLFPFVPTTLWFRNALCFSYKTLLVHWNQLVVSNYTIYYTLLLTKMQELFSLGEMKFVSWSS